MYIVRQEQRDIKGRFSLFEIELKDGVDVSYPSIRKVGRTQIQSNVDRATITSDIQIKTNNSKKGNKNKEGHIYKNSS